ncbi:class I SAM-dependent methyltransferase [Sulfurihydrogenibium azorense]|uniref:class I SAM-dependent methyltransferase n=1 Tax=Sulfurihydrogenibium azorense TaxID=309806 RepID=UPI003919D771
MEKHKGYQRLLEEGEKSTKEKLIFKISSKYKFLERKYWELSRLGLYGLKDIPNIKTASKILDIGCGSGSSFVYIKNFLNPNADFLGVDLHKNQELPDFVSFKVCDIDKDALPYEDESIDLVISIYVLEHLYNPGNLFSEAYRVLKKGGYFYCVTEYYTSLFCPDKYNFYQDPTHVRPWTKEALKSLGKMKGFDNIKVKRVRPIEYLGIIPFIPLLEVFKIADVSFIFAELLAGKTIMAMYKKDDEKHF